MDMLRAGALQGGKTALVIDPADNVAVVLSDIAAGETCAVRMKDRTEELTVRDNVPFGHKIAITAIAKGEPVIKYGEEIGKATETVEKGAWVHTHNLICERGMQRGR